MAETSGTLVIPEDLHRRQLTASDPSRSVWVSANAGSGKTHVLTQRVIRLLLGGVPPARILCLTFTKAAAAQVARRVFDRLAEWVILPDDRLKAAIVSCGAKPPNAEELARARRLFTRTVETPGGLKVLTIHAFCERLLHAFPFEANVPARFEVADELRSAEMLALAKRNAIDAAQRSTSEQAAALAIVSETAGAFAFDRLVLETLALRKNKPAGGDLQDGLRARLGSTTTVADAETLRLAITENGILWAEWPAIAAALDGFGPSDQAQASRFRKAAASARLDPASSETVQAYLEVFFSKEGRRGRLVTRAADQGTPDLMRRLLAEQARLDGLVDELRILETVERTDALIGLVDDILARYEHAKLAHGLLDFDDLIERTLTMLRCVSARWVMHKLDAGIDHVLVDEAQDTSEAQWRILESLTEEFAAGAGAHEGSRSLFVVGDDKQSIFSFQGAAPLMFDEMRVSFERRFKQGQLAFDRVALKSSFRSAPGILATVDTVFRANPAHRDGMVLGDEPWPDHDSIKTHLPSLIELWPRVRAPAVESSDEWLVPTEIQMSQDAPTMLAERVARKIATLLSAESEDRVFEGGVSRPVRPGDILILVRSRNAFFEAVIRALKRFLVPVAGADRLDVANHIAVLDLLAAGRAALLPDDDLSLACVLKSPLFNWSDDDLLALAPARTGPLSSALATSNEPRFAEARRRIAEWRLRANASTPFVFYMELLGRDGGRRSIEARLGPEAQDALDEFLRLALLHEQLGAPSLGGFIAEVEALQTTVKRDMEGPGDFVRVMTVHAAKGLEAKIVFLPDTCNTPTGKHDPLVFDLNKDSGNPPLIAWSPTKPDDCSRLGEARAAGRQAAMREYRRLLYVAMTRAEERLYIAGFVGANTPPDCWSAMIEEALGACEAIEVPAFWSETEIVRRIATGAVPGLSAAPAIQQDPLPMVPTWLSQKPADPAQTTFLRPSRAMPPSGRSGDDARPAPARHALQRGLAIHDLLQYLPAIRAEERPARARAFLATCYPAIAATDGDAMLAEVTRVMDLPSLAAAFGVHARAEFAVTGTLSLPDGETRLINGRIDRLAVEDGGVLLVDFKTGRREADARTHYIGQLGLYRRLLQPLWPHLPIRACLVWTRDAAVDVLAEDMLEAAAGAALAAP